MSNSLNDMRHARCLLFIGSNPPEAHPVAMQHILHARDNNGAPIIVVDPRRTKLAAKATEYVRIRPGTDAAFMLGLIHVITTNGWHDREFIRTRVAGYSEMLAVVEEYTPEAVENITGIPASQTRQVARLLAENRPASLTWCTGGTQHSIGSSVTRSFCLLQLVLGNMGKSGGGTNVLCGHDNVQGSVDMGVMADTLPAYLGLSEEAWKHWCRVWDVDISWLRSRFASPEYMERPGFTMSRWYEGVLQEEITHQDGPIRAMIQWGCGSTANSQLLRAKKALDGLEMLVVIDPFPTMAAAACEADNVYLLPSASQYETSGSVTSTSRQVQWRQKVVEPVHDSRDDYRIMALLVARLGFADRFYKNIRQVPEDITRELCRGSLSTGYSGRTPERIKQQMANWHTFDIDTLRAESGPCLGEYYGLPWPCWTEEHPGTPIMYDISRPVAEGGLPFSNSFGLEKTYDVSGRTENQLASPGTANPGSEVQGGYAEFTEVVPGTSWRTDLTRQTVTEALARGMAPSGNGRARCLAWNFPDQVPIHREPLHSPRPELIESYPTYADQQDHFRVDTRFTSEQRVELFRDYPYVLITGRVVGHMGAGAETSRSNQYLAELQPEMCVEINPRLGRSLGCRDGGMLWLESPEGGRMRVKAFFTERVDENAVFLPYHFAGLLQGESLLDSYPEGHAPYVMGESANVVTSYGYDIMTQIQATKDGLCRIVPDHGGEAP